MEGKRRYGQQERYGEEERYGVNTRDTERRREDTEGMG